MSVDAYQRAQEPEELHWIDGASHVDLYDKNEFVTPAVAKLTEFYTTNLAAAADKHVVRATDPSDTRPAFAERAL